MRRETVDVVVVGAGVAGLAAAGTLWGEGLEVAVVEARDRIGGRILTSPGLPPLEAGAEFLPRDGDGARLLAAAGGVFARTPDRHVRLEDGRAVALEMGGALEALRTAARSAGDDRSLADVLAASDLPGETAALIRRYVEQYHAAPLVEVSARWVAAVEETEEGGGGGEQVQALHGLDRLPRLLAEALPAGAIRLGSEALRVETTAGGAAVIVRDGAGEYRLEGRHVIVTVPVALLAAGLPRIESLPDAVRAALGWLRPGTVVKVGLRFRTAFWRDRLEPSGDAPSGPKFIHANPPFPTWWTSADLDAPTLVGWAGAGAAESLAGMDRDALLRLATSQVASLFHRPRADVREGIEEFVFHDWAADPWSRGAYAHAAPGGADAADRVGSLGPRAVLLAGEAISSAMGTVDGALGSGGRAARQILAARG